MKKALSIVLCVLFSASVLLLVSCQKKEETPAPPVEHSEKAKDAAAGYGEKAEEAVGGYGEKAKEAVGGYGK